MSQQSAKHAETKWRKWSYLDMNILKNQVNPLKQWSAVCRGVKISSNFALCSDETRKRLNLRFFIMDGRDMDCMNEVLNKCKNEEERDKVVEEYLMSLTSFVAKFPEKRVYIRSIPPVIVGGDNRSKLFADEVLEVIPILLKQQNSPVDDVEKKLWVCRLAWNNNDKLYHTQYEESFNHMLKQFDINKDLITIVQDVGYKLTQQEMLEKGNTFNRLIGPDGEVAMDTPQAMLCMFQSLVCGINWKNDECKIHEDCSKKLKAKIVLNMKKYAYFDEDKCMMSKHIAELIENVKKECPSKYEKQSSQPDYLLANHVFALDLPLDQYLHTITYFGLPNYTDFFANVKEKGCIPVWAARILYITGWIETFYDNNDKTKYAVSNASLYGVPFHMRDVILDNFLAPILNKKISKPPRTYRDTVLEAAGEANADSDQSDEDDEVDYVLDYSTLP